MKPTTQRFAIFMVMPLMALAAVLLLACLAAPAGAAAEQDCHKLTTSHEGQGATPQAIPLSSPGCLPGQFKAGQVITLSAWPADGWRIGGWQGTDDDASTAPFNQVTMPDEDRETAVIYVTLQEEWFVHMPMISG
jgi:hypothetical protein